MPKTVETSAAYLSAKQAAAAVPPRGVHLMTVHRWFGRGIIIGGRRVKLASVKLAGRRYTTKAWISEFLAAQQQTDESRDHMLSEKRRHASMALNRELAD